MRFNSRGKGLIFHVERWGKNKEKAGRCDNPDHLHEYTAQFENEAHMHSSVSFSERLLVQINFIYAFTRYIRVFQTLWAVSRSFKM